MPTCREMLLNKHPDRLGEIDKCWDRETDILLKPDQLPHILDSGTRREFETGAVRDIQEGKGRCDLLPLEPIATMLNSDELYFIEEFKKSGASVNLINSLMHFGTSAYPDRYTMFLEVSKHFEGGAKKYGEYNWQKGIPVHCYIDSAVRHYIKYKRGDEDEPHDRAFVWNLLCAVWTCDHKPELNEYVKKA